MDGIAEIRRALIRWFSDNDTVVGVFQNKDLGHPDIGRKVAFPYAAALGDEMRTKIGRMSAPDHEAIGLGWRYKLVSVADTVQEALDQIDPKETGEVVKT